jgi:PAS domain S-box-containing protein
VLTAEPDLAVAGELRDIRRELGGREIEVGSQAVGVHDEHVARAERQDMRSYSRDGTMTSWNRAAEAMLGYSEAEMIGRSVADIVRPENRHHVSDLLAQLAQGRNSGYAEVVAIAKDGRPADVAYSASPIHDAASTIIGASAFIRDLTESRKVQRELQRAAKPITPEVLLCKIREVLDAIPDGRRVVPGPSAPTLARGV